MKPAARWIFAMVATLGMLSACSGGDAEGTGGGAAGSRGGGGEGGGIQTGPLDRSDVSFVGNLLAKVEAGEWTLGEGLVATLKLFAGELDAASVLRHPKLLNYEGTGILAMADEYLADGADAEAKAEITRLLDFLVFSTEQLEAMAGLGPTPTAPPGQLTPRAPKAAADDCRAFFTGFIIPAGIDQCLEARSSPLLDELYPGDDGVSGAYRIFGPAASLPSAGWTEHHYDLTIEALEESVPVLKAIGGAKLTDVSVVLSVKDNLVAAAAAAPKISDVEPRPCGVVLYIGMQQEDDGDFKQFLAHELAHCLHGETFPKQDYTSRAWWDEGMAEYWSNVVYPTNNAEWEWLDDLARLELPTTLFDRAYENFLFYQYLSRHVGNEGIVDLIKSLGGANDRTTQEGKLAAYPGIKDIVHDFAEAKTDEEIVDTGGERIPYTISEVNRPTVRLTGPNFIQEDFEPFGVSRYRLVVDEGKLARLAFTGGGSVRESARPSEEMDWRELPSELPDDACNPEIIMVVTTTERNAGFELDIPEVEDAETSCDIVGTWVVQNSSIRFDPGEFMLTFVSGQISITFDPDGNAEVVYSGFAYEFLKDTQLDIGGVLTSRHEETTYTTSASGVTSYEVNGDRIDFGHLFESSYLVGTEEIHQVREYSPMIPGGNTDEVRERSPPGGIDLFGGSPKFELQSGGSVMNILGPGERVEAVLNRVGGP